MQIKFKKIHENAIIPTRGSEKAGGWDVYATEIIKESDNYYRIKTGFALQPPQGHKITIVPRSSLTKNNWIINNSPILGDEDYRGEYEIRFRGIPNDGYITLGDDLQLTYDEFPFSVGDRCCQLYLEEVIPIEFKTVEELDMTERNDGGFGSSGK